MDDGNFGYRSDVGWRKWTTAIFGYRSDVEMDDGNFGYRSDVGGHEVHLTMM